MLRVALLAIALAWWARPRVAAYARAVSDARSQPPGLAEFKDVSPEHHAAALDAWQRFDRAYLASFDITSLKATCSPVRRLVNIREDMLLAMGELRMRLPNDLGKEIRFVATQQAMDASMLERIQGSRKRLHTFASPGQTEAWFVLKDLRPANDVVT